MCDITRYRRDQRKSAADTLRSLRAASTGLPVGKRNKLLRRLILSNPDIPVPLKPTASNLYREMRGTLAFSRTPIHTISSEYYSYCGYEDGQWEDRQEAKRYALDLFRAWKSARHSQERNHA